ncbi:MULTISPECIES: hypothetical protein [Cupriavidus]
MFYDYYLRGADRDTTRAALLAAGLTVDIDVDGETRRVPAAGASLSTIGTICTGGEWDADGNLVTEPVAVPGWHVNLRLSRPLEASEVAALAGMEISPAPATPYRVWAE